MSKAGNGRLHAAVKLALTGASTVDLRDLVPNRTLLLVNGLRLPPGEPKAAHPADDIGHNPVPQPDDDR